MKTNLYLFVYTHDGKEFRDFVAAESMTRAEYIHANRYPNVKEAQISLFDSVLV